MADETRNESSREPVGFGEHSRGLSGEYAHEQGWGLNVEERTKQPATPQDIDGGSDYNYGAADFGDDPVDTTIPPDAREVTQNMPQSTPKASK